VSGPRPSASFNPAASHTSAGHPTPTLGHPHVHLRRTGSTNERARELAFAGAPHGTLVTADEQTAGRGRQGRRWIAPAGSSLLTSLLLREVPPLLPLIAAVAVCDVAGAGARIKWPNDVVLETAGAGDRVGLAKLGGILIEGRPQSSWAVLGIGLNVALRIDQLPTELRSGAGSGAGATSGLPAATLGLEPADVAPTLARLIDALVRRLGEPEQATLQAWRARDALHGREIAWGSPVDGEPLSRGRAEGVDDAGRLLVALADGSRETIAAGEVHLREIA
jgi:BirA family transcriptional regulator, biotin operon repressor / biotin---[acetyl-CoA-carboxylase] ligase